MTRAPPTSSSVDESMSGLGTRLRVRLYVAGRSPNSVLAANTLRALIAEFPSLGVELETVDVLREPERALRDGVLATPMLIKLEPLPERRILGNLSDRKTVLAVLGLGEAHGE